MTVEGSKTRNPTPHKTKKKQKPNNIPRRAPTTVKNVPMMALNGGRGSERVAVECSDGPAAGGTHVCDLVRIE